VAGAGIGRRASRRASRDREGSAYGSWRRIEARSECWAKDWVIDCGIPRCYKPSNLYGEASMGSGNLWYEVRQITTADLLGDVTVAWLLVGAAFTALFLA
jgi:hypothetical protein